MLRRVLIFLRCIYLNCCSSWTTVLFHHLCRKQDGICCCWLETEMFLKKFRSPWIVMYPFVFELRSRYKDVICSAILIVFFVSGSSWIVWEKGQPKTCTQCPIWGMCMLKSVLFFYIFQFLVQGKQSPDKPASLNVFVPCLSTRVLVPKKASNRFPFRTRLPRRLQVWWNARRRFLRMPSRVLV